MHVVGLTKGFYLGKYEVTQAQFQVAMGSNPSRSTKNPECPVDNVSEDDARQFCIRVSEIAEVEARLPTEAEWEYASRAGRKTKWFFGEDPSPIGEYAWFKGNAGGKSHPVGRKSPTLGASTTSTETLANASPTSTTRTTMQTAPRRIRPTQASHQIPIRIQGEGDQGG